MCGICGYVGDHRPELLEPMCMSMVHRGPDDMGTWFDEKQRVGLGHRRLSIIDLSAAGHQPMCNEDGTIWVTYNGEIYNFPELRDDLLARGHVFQSRTDTEVLVHLYEEMGPEFVTKLNGMWAFGLWDSKLGQLLLARGHAGVKPLYYWQNGDRLFFASEIKALLRIPEIPRELNTKCLPDYLTFLWVPGKETMLKAIHKIEPGYYLLWKDGKVVEKRWFSLNYEADESVSEGEWVEQIHDTLMRVVKSQLVSDVPLGAFLSGGTDSSSIVACMRRLHPDRQIKCYTIRFHEGDLVRDQFVDDYPYARRVANRLKTQLVDITLDPQVVALLPKMVYHLDEPDADPAVYPNYLISKLAREDGTTVLLSGTGGDEVFFGYRSHVAYRQYLWMDWLPVWITNPVLGVAARAARRAFGAQGRIPRRIHKFRRGLLGRGVERHLLLADWSDPSTRSSIYSSDLRARLTTQDVSSTYLYKYSDTFVGYGEINRHSWLLIHTFLAAHNFLYTDKSSMAVSVETRVPFMDMDLLRLAARIPERLQLKHSTPKYLLKKALTRYFPRDILYRSKTGFGAPLRKWIADDLRGPEEEYLGPQQVARRGLFEPQAIQSILEENRSNKADHAYLIYALLTLEVWMRSFLDRPGQEIAL